MNAAQKIQHLTGRFPAEVREWAYVYWVRFSSGRPTFFSKRMVDRAAFIEVIRKDGDAIVRDNYNNVAYITRPNWELGHSIKELKPGTRVNLSRLDFAEFSGPSVSVPHVLRPKRVSDLISCVVHAA